MMIFVNELLIQKKTPLVMGIINCTPDSFYAESRKMSLSSAIAAAEKMAEEGADILDIGGESTRPGADYIDTEEELARVIPVIRALTPLGLPVSVDTRKSIVARRALEAGASIINDISALQDDEETAAIIKEAGCDVVLMHKKGIPLNMQDNPFYNDPVLEIRNELEKYAEEALQKGIARDRIIIDPGIGFGKRAGDNLSIINKIGIFKKTGYPLLIGCSRKSFIGAVTGREVSDRLSGSIAACIMAALNGADIVRVHDVGETVDALKIVYAVKSSQE